MVQTRILHLQDLSSTAVLTMQSLLQVSHAHTVCFYHSLGFSSIFIYSSCMAWCILFMFDFLDLDLRRCSFLGFVTLPLVNTCRTGAGDCGDIH